MAVRTYQVAHDSWRPTKETTGVVFSRELTTLQDSLSVGPWVTLELESETRTSISNAICGCVCVGVCVYCGGVCVLWGNVVVVGVCACV